MLVVRGANTNGLRPRLGSGGTARRWRSFSTGGTCVSTGRTLTDGRGACCGGALCVSDDPTHPVASAAATMSPAEREVMVTAISESSLQDTQYTTLKTRVGSAGHRNPLWYTSTCTPIRSSVYHLR